MAKTFQEKAAWIEAIEKVTMMKQQQTPVIPKSSSSSSSCKSRAGSSSLVNWDIIATFPTETNVFCSVQLQTGEILFGTSDGLYKAPEDAEVSSKVEAMASNSESIFQMDLIEEADDVDEVVMIIGMYLLRCFFFKTKYIYLLNLSIYLKEKLTFKVLSH